MRTETKFSRFRILVRLLTRYRCQSNSVLSKATLYQYLHREPTFSLPRFCMKLQQRGLHQSWRLLSTNTETHSAHPKDKEVDTLISSLPYDTLAYDPHLYSYNSLLHSRIEEYIEKGIPFLRPFFCRLMRLLDKQGRIDHDEAAILLDSTGIANVHFPDDKKAEFTRWVWNKIQDNGLELVKKDINLFNLYMKVLLENKAPLTPIEIEAEIQDRQLTPNRITYHMKIASACERGDLTEVREQLQEVMRLNIPISTSLYNTLILGYCKAGCIDMAEEMLQSMGNHGLEADNLTYGNFMLGCAERGDIEKIKKYIEDSGLSLDPHSSLELVVLLAKNGYSEKAYQVLDILKEKIKPNVLDVAWAVTSLLHNGHYRLAFKLNGLLGLTSGHFFGVFAVLSNMPVDHIVNFMRQSRQLKYRECDLVGLVKEAAFCGEFDILRLQPYIERMTIWQYAPALKIMYMGLRGLGKTYGDAVQILRDNNNLDEGEFNAAMINTLLITEPLHIAKAEVEKMETLDTIFLLPMFQSALIERFLQKPDDWRDVFEFVAELRKKKKSELNCFFVVKIAMELLLKEGMSLEPLVDFMIKNQLKVLNTNSHIYAPGVSREKLQQIEIDRAYLGQIQYTHELEQVLPEDRKVFNHHLRKAANNMDRRTVESILANKDFRRIRFIDRDAKVSVIDMYTKLCDADSALFHTSELTHTPTRDGTKYRILPNLALKIAVALWKEDRCEAALDILSENPVLDWDRITARRKLECKRCLNQLLNHDQNQDFKNRLVDVLVKNNFLKRNKENSRRYSKNSVNTSISKK